MAAMHEPSGPSLRDSSAASSSPARRRKIAVALAAIVMAALASGVGLALRERPRLEAALRVQLEQALQELSPSGRVQAVHLELPAQVVVRGLSVDGDNPGPGLRVGQLMVGVDPLRAILSRDQPQRAIRYVSAHEVEVRLPPGGQGGLPVPGMSGNPGPESGPDGGADGSPATLRETAAQAHQAVVSVLAWLAGPGRTWLQIEDRLGLDLSGVWDAAGRRTPWSIAGELRVGAGGAVGGQARFRFGDVRGDLALEADPGGRQLRITRLQVEDPRGRLAATGQVVAVEAVAPAAGAGGKGAAPGPALKTHLEAQLEYRAGEGAAATTKLVADGTWTPQRLPTITLQASGPPAEMATSAAASQGGALWWLTYVAGARGSVRLIDAGDRFEVQEGVYTTRSGGSMRFAGTVGATPPYPLALEVVADRLVPDQDLPWWPGYRVAALDLKGRIGGNLRDGPAARGELKTSGGQLLGLPAGAASAQFTATLGPDPVVDVPALSATLGSGAVNLAGRLAWGPSGGGSGRVRLELRGHVRSVATVEVVRAVQVALAPPGAPPPAAATPSDGELDGVVDGDVRAAMAWVPTARGDMELQLESARFDSPDATLEASRLATAEAGAGAETAAYRFAGELISLQGRAWRPWTRGMASGVARFEARMDAQGGLSGQVEAEGLRWGDQVLGHLQTPVHLAGETWQVGPGTLTGGDLGLAWKVEGKGELADIAASMTAPGSGLPPLSVSGTVRVAATRSETTGLTVQMEQQTVAVMEGFFPAGRQGMGDPNAAMDLALRVDRLPGSWLGRFLPDWQVEGGELNGQLRLTGRPGNPVAQGHLTGRADALRWEPVGFGPLLRPRMDVRLDGNRLEVVQGEAATENGGRITLSGGARVSSLSPMHIEPVDLQARLQRAAVALQLPGQVAVSGRLDGRVGLAGAYVAGTGARPPRLPTLTGDVEVTGGQVALRGLLGGDWLDVSEAGSGQARVTSPAPAAQAPAAQAPAAPGRAPAAPAVGWPLDMRVAATTEPLRFEAQALGASALLRGSVQVQGTTAAPVLVGEVDLEQGNMRYLGREFRVDRGRLTFTRSGGLRPRVEIDATTSSEEGPVHLFIEGETSQAPQSLQVSSDPPMSREALLGLLRPPLPAAGQPLSERWVAMLNQQLAAWSLAPVQRAVRSALGLDDVWLVPVPAEQRLMVYLGKYLVSQHLYVRYGRALFTPDASQELELSLRTRLGWSWRAALSDSGDYRLTLIREFRF